MAWHGMPKACSRRTSILKQKQKQKNQRSSLFLSRMQRRDPTARPLTPQLPTVGNEAVTLPPPGQQPPLTRQKPARKCTKNARDKTAQSKSMSSCTCPTGKRKRKWKEKKSRNSRLADGKSFPLCMRWGVRGGGRMHRLVAAAALPEVLVVGLMSGR